MFRIIVGILILSVAWLAVEGIAWLAHSYEYLGDATVLQTIYTPESTSTGVGPTTSGNGGVVVISSTTSEKFVVLVKLNDDAVSIEVPSTVFASLEKDQTVGVYRRTGLFLYSDKIGEVE